MLVLAFPARTEPDPLGRGSEQLAGAGQRRLVGADRVGETDFQRVGRQFVADRGFRQVRQRGDEARQVSQIEVVPGIDDEPGCAGARRGLGAGAQFGRAVAGAECGGIGTGIDLDAVGPGIAQTRDDIGVGIDKQDDAAAERLQRGDGGLDDRVVACRRASSPPPR